MERESEAFGSQVEYKRSTGPKYRAREAVAGPERVLQPGAVVMYNTGSYDRSLSSQRRVHPNSKT